MVARIYGESFISGGHVGPIPCDSANQGHTKVTRVQHTLPQASLGESLRIGKRQKTDGPCIVKLCRA